MEPSQNSDMKNFFLGSFHQCDFNESQLLLSSATMLLVIEAGKSGVHH
jgi:hypothetical protein